MNYTMPSTAGWKRTLALYALFLGGGLALFFWLRALGEASPAAVSRDLVPQPTASDHGPGLHVLGHVLLALAVVMMAGQLVGRLFARLGQPPVIGEVIAGIVLGPSLLGWLWPEATAFILPREVAPYLGIIAQLGVILFMFLVGIELNTSLLRRQAHATVIISHTSIIVPFLLGAALALYLFPRLAPDNVGFTSFAMFMGVAMSITAFPVLARILADRGLSKTPLGILALSCAAIDDVTAWCLLALVVGVAKATLDSAVIVFASAAVYVLGMLFVARPLVEWFAQRYEHAAQPRRYLPWVFLAVLLSALATEMIGIHALFGAFLLGALIPHDSTLARDLNQSLHDLVTLLFLPAFFAFTGLRTQIGLVAGWEMWLACGLIFVVATIGKVGGAYGAARSAGIDQRASLTLGALMNTRGLMELIVLNVGLELGVISPTLYAMMVLMALATTMMTGPLLTLLQPARQSCSS